MPRLKSRVGPDCLNKLEHAARRRYVEAGLLINNEPLGAIYLYGYSFEIRLKVASYRLAGVPGSHDLSQHLPSLGKSPWNWAVERVRNLLTANGIPHSNNVGHHLYGWMLLVEDIRISSGLGPFAIPFRQDLDSHTDRIWDIWTEILRYRANKPYNSELSTTVQAASWLKQNYQRLWR